MNDDEFDELLRAAAPSYNLPPEPPREAMWERIAAAREAAHAPVAITAPRTRWLRRASAIAAVLVLGIAIGRYSHRAAPPAPGTVAAADPATSGKAASTAPAAPPDEASRPAALASSEPATAPALDADVIDSIASRPSPGAARRFAMTQRADRRAARRGGGASARVAGSTGVVGDGTDELNAHRVAVLEHLTRTEVLLTGFRAQSRTGEARTDAQFAGLARELLGTTRLLIATKATDDPTLSRLLEDLELVLMQISQYTTDGRRADLDAINQSLDRRNVIPKLRSTIPAGVSASAGT
jgi:hypothetical protein